MHEVLVNRLGGLSLPRKRVVRFTDRSDMTFDVYRGRKTKQQQWLEVKVKIEGHEFELFNFVSTPKNSCLNYACSRSRSQFAPWISSQAWNDIVFTAKTFLLPKCDAVQAL